MNIFSATDCIFFDESNKLKVLVEVNLTEEKLICHSIKDDELVFDYQLKDCYGCSFSIVDTVLEWSDLKNNNYKLQFQNRELAELMEMRITNIM